MPKTKKIDKRFKTPDVLREEIEMDPRKSRFKAYFMDPSSDSYSNYSKSAVKAGFTQNYANNITVLKPKWLFEVIGKQDYLDKARNNLKRDLAVDIYSYTTTGRGKNKKKVKLGINSKVMKNVQDATMFVLQNMDEDFKPKEKISPNNVVSVEFKQVIIINPNANPESATGYKTDTEAVPSVSTPQ